MLDGLIKRILTARVYDVAEQSPLETARNLSRKLHNNIYLKREDLQRVFSFKLRGAYNCMFHLTEEEKRNGVIASSAGNHAQGVALAGRKLGIKATIVMPCTTPDIKVQAVRDLGGNAVLEGNSYDDAYAHAIMLAEQHQLTFIHPFDNLDVIAGQGTVGMEILHQHPDPVEAIFVPVGGGGLISGVAAYVKYLLPEVKIIGVEHEEAPSMYEALRQQERVVLKQVGIFADGAAVKQVGTKTFKCVQEYVDEILLVSTDETCAAIKDMFEETRTLLEPAGALAIAGMKKYIERQTCQDQELIAISSGANINFDRLRHVAERAELGEKREALFAVTIPERPGSFRRFCNDLGNRSITEFNYRYTDKQQAQVFAGIKLTDGEREKRQLLDQLHDKGYAVIDLSNDEVAKLHLRYMVGGHAEAVTDERLYRFEFPERPSALLRFLSSIGETWNISLFHYRNHGADYGRVLTGIQVPVDKQDLFQHFLDELGYVYWDETDNPAYALFLA